MVSTPERQVGKSSMAPCTTSGPNIGPIPTDLPYIPPAVAAPQYLEKRECAAEPYLLHCNPGDAVLGGGDDDLRVIGAKWFLGAVEGATSYGEDSKVAHQVMASDLVASWKAEIIRRWAQAGDTKNLLKPYSIGKSRSALQQFAKDGRSMITGDSNLSTAVLGSHTAEYQILRANSRGIQARITIENSMTMSSFAHVVTGYGTRADKFVQSFDHDGIVATGIVTPRPMMTSHHMTITFRVTVPN